jgi:hypothetical protein
MSEFINPEQNPPSKERKITRKDFLKMIIAFGLTASAFGIMNPRENKKVKKSEATPEPNNNIKETSEENYENTINILTKERVAYEIREILKANNYEDILKICDNVKQYRQTVETYSKARNVNPNYIMGMIFVESKGDKEAYNTTTGATGLLQFLTDTAKDFNISNRNSPTKSINGATKFISHYKKYLGKEDFAVESFHMGYGNMCHLIDLFSHPERYKEHPKEIIINKNLTYPKLYFKIKQDANSEMYKFLFNELEDQSAEYYFKVLAATSLLKVYNNPAYKYYLKILSQKHFQRSI